MDRGAQWATVHGVAESQTGPKQLNNKQKHIILKSRKEKSSP